MVYNRNNQAIFKTGDKDIVKAIITEREKPLSLQNVIYLQILIFC